MLENSKWKKPSKTKKKGQRVDWPQNYTEMVIANRLLLYI